MVTGVTVGALFLGLQVIMAAQADLPKLADQQPVTEALTSQIFADDGSSLAYLFGQENRTVISSEDISTFLKQAIVAIEDKRFYEHNGVDFEGLARALVINLKSNSFAQGASTITQQLVGALFLDRRDITMTRKIKEAALAIQYEKEHTKDEILTQYLNTVYFGANAYGVEAAAQTYFGKAPSDLTLTEAAMLAGLPQAPTAYNPRRDTTKALARRNEVLTAMLDQGYITAAKCEEGIASPIELAPFSPYNSVREPYVVDYVKQQLIDMFGKDKVFQGGLRVQTTIDPTFQQLARNAIKSVLNRTGDPSAAILSVDPNSGYIRAMVSSSDYDKTKFNLAAQSHRQPGSAFKPFCLVAALEQGINPVTTVYRSAPQVIQIPGSKTPWKVSNFGNSYYGSSNIVEATLHSDNSIYSQLMMDVGVQNVVNVAHAMGITSPINADPAIVLGGLTYGVSPLDMASAYGTLATGGKHVEPTIITKVWDASGKVIWEARPKVTQAIPANVAYTATAILEMNVQRGTGTKAQIGRPAAGKTGTATDFCDAWFCGFTPHLATAVWVGHPEGLVPMRNVHGISVTGGSFPAMIWHNFMYGADRTYPAGDFPGPKDVFQGYSVTLSGPTNSSSTTSSSTTSTTARTTSTSGTTTSGSTTTTARQTTSTTRPPRTTTSTSPPTTSPSTTSPPTTSPPKTTTTTTSPPKTTTTTGVSATTATTAASVFAPV